MRHSPIVLMIAVCATSDVAIAEVVDASPGGFSLVQEVAIDAPRSDVWRAAVYEVGQWWSSNHTISGDARNMRIDPRPQGCFCEAIGEHTGVVHLTVTFVNTDVLLRLTGGLGPLGLMGVSGNMTWEFFDTEAGTRVVFSYVVGGYSPSGLDEIAGPVDFVIGEALQRLKAHIETGDADNASIE
ncbi:MAG: ATPase [Gammaproteobacteria bacterium]|nr:ATPase [Gammaproteobacteria bacterium]MDH3409473.1 ATPase [Gammaproteobacteria bacterium]MDH3552086.1 ATPase [Gammaproteobacteria bacterium]